MYKPTQEDLKFAKEVYDDIIFKQILNPNAVKAAYKRLFGVDAMNWTQARIKISSYFMYQFKPEMLEEDKSIDKTETAVIDTPSIVLDEQSHSEEIIEKPKRKRNVKRTGQG